MDMFDNFTFDPVARTPSIGSVHSNSTSEPSRSVSPCSPTASLPVPRFSVTDLAASFASSRLRTDSQICYDSCQTYANMDDDDAAWAIPAAEETDDLHATLQHRVRSARPHSPSRRKQRQMNTRLLCSTNHARDVAELVTRMMECRDQCTVMESDSVTADVDDEDDEGYNSCEGVDTSESRRITQAMTKARLDFRRSSDIKGACVSKAVRLRKRKSHGKTRSVDSE